MARKVILYAKKGIEATHRSLSIIMASIVDADSFNPHSLLRQKIYSLYNKKEVHHC